VFAGFPNPEREFPGNVDLVGFGYMELLSSSIGSSWRLEEEEGGVGGVGQT